jgi:hypothetical protein
MTDKVVNYTPEQVAELVQKYQQGTSVETLADSFGKSVRSIVAKLSREGVYQAKARTSANRVTKLDMVTEIAQWIGCDHFEVASLEKASHEALSLLLARVRS